MEQPEDPLTSAIDRLRRDRDAVILAHSYQPPAIQDIADFVGDSLELSRRARDCPESVVVFCGVRFMAETAHILAPEKKVIHPEPAAGCPLADSIDPSRLESFRKGLEEDALTVMYVNSPAGAKAMSYSCCTSANAVDVVRSVPSDSVVFAPDRNLGTFVGRQVRDKRVHVYPGACTTHAGADVDDVRDWKSRWPDAEVLAHPETPPALWELSDHILGTGGMITRVSRSAARRFLIATELGMVYRLQTLFPEREFMAVGGIYCPDMKVITLEKIARSLDSLAPLVSLPEDLRLAALRSVERMTEKG